MENQQTNPNELISAPTPVAIVSAPTARQIAETAHSEAVKLQFLSLWPLMGHHISNTAKALGVHRGTIHKWLKEDKEFRALMEKNRDLAFANAEVTLSEMVSRLWSMVDLDALDVLEFGLSIRRQTISVNHDGEPIELETVIAKLKGIPKRIRRLLTVRITDKGVEVELPDRLAAMRELAKINKLYEDRNSTTVINLTVNPAPTEFPDLDPAMEVKG